MSLLDVLLLGLIQGVTEFLPISSTAHLRVVPALLGEPDPGAALTAVLQLGSLAAVIGFFLRDLLGMFQALLDPVRRKTTEGRMLLYLVLGTLPVGLCGLAFRHHIEGPLRSLVVIATALITVAILMFIADRTTRGAEAGAAERRGLGTITLRDALLVGCAQALALVPGVSRSGITLVAGMAIGLRRDAAARFSFLLSVPAIGAAGVFELPKVLRADGVSPWMLLAGLLAAAVSGYASIAWLLRYLRTRATTVFVVYRVLLGVLLLVGVALHWWPA
jgi:undecaprenyl-diphosphatase